MWTNDSLVTLESLLACDDAYLFRKNKVDLIYNDRPFAA